MQSEDRIDVIILTKNSEDTINECLVSVQRHVPFCHFIIVDGFSEDRTLKIVREKIKKNLIIIQTDMGLAMCRQLALKVSDSEWVAFIDSDIEVNENWKEMLPLTKNEKVGAVEGLADGNKKEEINYIKFIQRHFPFLYRHWTANTLIRKTALKGFNPPEDLKFYEDEYIYKTIKKNNYKWICLNDKFYAFHHGKGDRFLKEDIIYGRKYNLLNLKKVILSLILSLLIIFKFGTYPIKRNLIVLRSYLGD
jgi:glycosyltransferase involved in cell wall biosynthesis